MCGGAPADFCVLHSFYVCFPSSPLPLFTWCFDKTTSPTSLATTCAFTPTHSLSLVGKHLRVSLRRSTRSLHLRRSLSVAHTHLYAHFAAAFCQPTDPYLTFRAWIPTMFWSTSFLVILAAVASLVSAVPTT
jgi:hypothetical protein